MSSSESGGISKLIIKAYADDQFSSQAGEEFEAFINPENIAITSGVDYKVARSMGVAGGSLMYNTSTPRILKFSLRFDATGAFQGLEESVVDQTEQLKKVIYDYQDDIHSPYYIRVIWGVIDFKGRLGGLDLRYTMFGPDGKPVRAEAEVAIIEDVEAFSKASKLAGGDAASSTGLAAGSSQGAGAATSAAAGAAAGGAAASNAAGGAAADGAAGRGDASGAAAGDGDPSAAAQTSAAEGEGAAAGQGVDGEGADAEGTDPTADGQEGIQDSENPQDQDPGAAEKTSDQEGGPQAGDPTDAENSDAALADGEVYETKEGDTPASIADKKYGDPSKGADIAKLNGLPSSFAELPAGMKLALPFSLAALAAALAGGLLKQLMKALQWLKKKGKQAYNKGKKGAGKAAGKVKDKAKKVSQTAKK